jgi:hypothetical protein
MQDNGTLIIIKNRSRRWHQYTAMRGIFVSVDITVPPFVGEIT